MKVQLKRFIKFILPKGVLDKIKGIRTSYFLEFDNQSYSQEGEDMILNRIFEGKTNGFYIDVGAHHPKRFSNTYFFYKQGWRGINIDAMPNSMHLFNKIRPRDINLEIAISSESKKLTYYEFNEPALNGFSEELSKDRDGLRNYKIINQLEITTHRLDDVLKNLKNEIPTEIDFLSIDVEGLDFEVLQSLNFNVYKPRVILIEILTSNLEDIAKHEIADYLKKFDYEIFAKTVNTVFFKIIDEED